MSKKQHREASRRWKENHPDYAAEYYKRNREKLIARAAEYSRNNREKVYEYHKQAHWAGRRKRIGKRTRCEICRKIFARAYEDHDHAVAKAICGHRIHGMCKKCRRGILCCDCNMGLGRFLDSPRLLKKAGQYIKKWRKILKIRNGGYPYESLS